jgi:hypothetical protein
LWVYHIYCLKSKVVTNQEKIAIQVVVDVSGSVHDMGLFKNYQHHLSALIMLHEGEPTEILADKGYIGEVDDSVITLVTLREKSGGLPLDRMQARYNRDLGSARVIIENDFGRLQVSHHGSKMEPRHRLLPHHF